MKNSIHLEFSEINKKLLGAFLLTKPLYIATIMYESIQNKDTNTLLEIVSTQKLEDLNVAMKIMITLHPNLKLVKLDNDKIDFGEFSKGQSVFDGEKLEHFLNWRFDPNCNEKPTADKIGWLNNPMKKIQNYMKNSEQRCLENPTISHYMEMLENKKALNSFFLLRFNCAMKAFENQKQEKTSLHVNNLIQTLILSYSIEEESINHLMKVNEKKELEDKINNAYFNLQGWNGKVFKYACKRLLNLENASQVMSYNRFIEHYGENVVAFTNALTNVESLVNIKTDNKKVIITNDKLFNALNKVPGSSILIDLIEKINDGILVQLNTLITGKINNQKGNDLIIFISNHLRAAYLALSLALNHVVEKLDDNESKDKNAFKPNSSYLIRKKRRCYGNCLDLSHKANAMILHGILSLIGVVVFSFFATGLADLKCRFPEIDDFQNLLRRRQNSPTIPQQHEIELPHLNPEPSQPHHYQGYPQYYDENPNVAIGIPVNYHNLRYSRSIHKTQK
uniref:Uncharacterized protein n=1 Tax=Meloidogyne javanica TaxID=6303 RepID=A0A915N823_MELJA